MKKAARLRFALIFCLLFLLFVPLTSALSQTTEESVGQNIDYYPPSNSQPAGLFGQDHYYTVTFRGNGEAVVTTKITFTNSEDEVLTEIEARVPKAYPQEISAYQVLQERRCIRYYNPPRIQPEPDERPLIYPPIAPTPTCQEWRQPDYFGPFYGKAKYQKAQWELRGDTIVIDLPQDVKPDASASVVLYFRGFGYASKTLFGAYKYSFETLKVEDKIRQATIAINVDSDLFLKGGKGEVNYRFEENFAPLKSIGTDQAVESSRFDTFYRQIGSGQIVKKASNLAPLESYTVKGKFADSRLKLYGKEIVLSILVVWFVGAFVFYLARVYIGRWRIKQNYSRKKDKKKGAGEKIKLAGTNIAPFVGVLATSLGSSFLILIYTLLLFLASRFLTSVYYNQMGTIVLILLIIISVGFYALLLFGPPIFIWIKKGAGWGVLTFFLTLLWLVFYLIIVFLILFILSQGRKIPEIPVPIPMLEK